MTAFSEWLRYLLTPEGSQCQSTLIQRLLLPQTFLCSVILSLASANCHMQPRLAAWYFLTCFALPGGQPKICLAQQVAQPEQKEIFSYFLISFLFIVSQQEILILCTQRSSKDCNNSPRGCLSLFLEALPMYAECNEKRPFQLMAIFLIYVLEQMTVNSVFCFFFPVQITALSFQVFLIQD